MVGSKPVPVPVRGRNTSYDMQCTTGQFSEQLTQTLFQSAKQQVIQTEMCSHNPSHSQQTHILVSKNNHQQ